MRNLIALFACSFAVLTANANDSAPAAAANNGPASAPAAAKAAPPAKPRPLTVAQQRAREEQAEIELSEKIAARLAELREKQQQRAAVAAKARKVTDEKRRREAAAAAIAATPRGTHWAYEGEYGPANWSKINVDWAKCSTGKRQSPIDIRDGMKVHLEPIAFDYHPSSFSEIDNGRTIEVTVGGGNFINVANQTYELQQFHFHRPSEEKINGKGTEMVMHLVHKSPEGRLAILAVLLERGKEHSLVQTVWNHLPLEKHERVSPSILIDPNEALPERREYYTFMGSLSAPPCTEGVLWMVMKQPMQASPAQMALFSRLYPFNARPVQQANGRVIKASH